MLNSVYLYHLINWWYNENVWAYCKTVKVFKYVNILNYSSKFLFGVLDFIMKIKIFFKKNKWKILLWLILIILMILNYFVSKLEITEQTTLSINNFVSLNWKTLSFLIIG